MAVDLAQVISLLSIAHVYSVLPGVNGAVRIGMREVKFLDHVKTNVSEGIPQVYLP